jgi:putative ABC transport system ATP-binding protein
MTMPLIDLKKISKTYDSGGLKFTALHEVTVEIQQGEFVAIMGPSGSGKSTLMNIMGFLDGPSTGHYILNGNAVTDFDEDSLAEIRNKEIGFVFQMFYLLPRMSALDNVKLPLIYANISKEEQNKKALKALAAVGLEDKVSNRPNQMSGGQQQRVAIARALVNDPKIIFADEPTGNLDSKSSKEIMDIFKRLNAEGHTIIMVTHEPETAKHARRILTIKDGKILSDKPSS